MSAPSAGRGGKCITREHQGPWGPAGLKRTLKQYYNNYKGQTLHCAVLKPLLRHDTTERFRFNEKKFFHSQKDTIVNQLHMYNGKRYKQDKNRHKRKIEKSKRTVTRVHFRFYTSDICLILCNKQKRKAFVRRETGNLNKKCDFFFFLHFKWWRVNI